MLANGLSQSAVRVFCEGKDLSHHQFEIYRLSDFAAFFTPSAEPRITLGMQVFVDNPQFTGYGIAQYDTGDRKRCIGVLLENGHTWEYDIATVRNAELDELPKMPRAIRDYKRPSVGESQP
jgi:hypothetical protein